MSKQNGVLLTNWKSEVLFFDAMCNALDYMESSYGISVCYDEDDYDKAKGVLTNPCYEDVLMQILRQGDKLRIRDLEGNCGSAVITLQHVHDRVCNTPLQHLCDALMDNGDATTSEVILQTVYYNEIIFG